MIRPTAPTAELARDLRIDDVIAGTHRLSPADAMRLYHEAPLHDLGRWATAVADRIHGNEARTYVIDRNINYANVCSAACTFCAFKRDLGDDDAYVLTTAELHEKVQALSDIGGTQILMQGGMHPELPLEWYVNLLRGLKEKFPEVHVHAFSPPEIVEFIAVLEIEGFPTTPPGKSSTLPPDVWRAKCKVILETLRDAGMDSLPGGGGEIFAETVRRRIGVGKATGDEWLEVMSVAHEVGMRTSSTMMFGHIEGVADRIDHMHRIRDRQDLAIEKQWPGKYLSFISWPFQPENTPLGRIRHYEREGGEPFPGDELADLVMSGKLDAFDKATARKAVPEAGRQLRLAGGSEYLRMQAISRLFMDNIHSVGSSWVTMGPRVGQMGLMFGANDMGSVMMEENVVSAAGTTYCLSEPVLCQLIREAGYTPAQRGNSYEILKVHDGDDAPDKQVTDWSTQRTQKLHVQGAAEGDEGGTIPLTIGGAEAE